MSDLQDQRIPLSRNKIEDGVDMPLVDRIQGSSLPQLMLAHNAGDLGFRDLYPGSTKLPIRGDIGNLPELATVAGRSTHGLPSLAPV